MAASLNGGSVRILWDASDSAEVTITGGVAAFTVNGSAVTFPYTLSSSTTFETTHSGVYTISVEHHGYEIAGTPDGTREVELRFGAQHIFEPTIDGGGGVSQDLMSRLSATYARKDGLGFTLSDAAETAATTSDPYPIGTINGIGYGNKEAGTNPGLYKTTDGATWTYVGPTAGYGIHALGDGEVLLNQNGALKRSTGWATNPATATWATVATPNGTSGFIRSNVDTHANIVIAAEYANPRTDARYVKVSTDYGKTFTNALDLNVIEPGDEAQTHWHAVCIDPYHDGANPRLWASHGDGPVHGVYYSDNLGATWTNYANNWQPMPLAATPAGIVTMTDGADPDGVWLIPRDLGPRQLLHKIERPYWNAALVGFGVAAHRDEASGVVHMLFRIDQQTYFTRPVGAMIFATDGVRADLVYTTEQKGTVGVAGTIDFLGRPTLVAGKLLAEYADTASARHLTTGTVGRGVNPSVPSKTLTSVALGADADADLQTVAIGASARRSASTDAQAVAVGESAVAGDKGAAVGYTATAGLHGIAIGYAANATSEATAIGSQAAATNLGVALGRGSNASGSTAIAIGRQITAAGNAAIAISPQFGTAEGAGAVRVGNGGSAAGQDSVSLGTGAASAGAIAIAIGSSAAAAGGNGIAIGNGASTGTSDDNIAIGRAAATGNGLLRAVALGAGTTATGWDQVHIGQRHMEATELTADPGAPSATAARLYFKNDATTGSALYVQTATGVYKVTMA